MAAGAHLTDTNILLRIAHRKDPQYLPIRSALETLRRAGTRLCYTSQNLAEFWNVCTRPAVNNGYGLSIEETNNRAQLIEASFSLLPDNDLVHIEWRKLVVTHSVAGVQVHDARLVASMHVHSIPNLLTLNTGDFRRYRTIDTVHPSQVT